MIQDLTQPETDEEQPNYSLRTPWATTDSERADFYALKEIPRVKRIDHSLHATSKELTFSNLKDRGVEKRLKFRLRVISRYSGLFISTYSQIFQYFVLDYGLEVLSTHSISWITHTIKKLLKLNKLTDVDGTVCETYTVSTSYLTTRLSFTNTKK